LILPERLLKSGDRLAFNMIRSARQVCEQLPYNLLFK